VRDVLALILCGNRICEVTTATLGPLPLDQLPKSKPVTPYAVSIIVPARRVASDPAAAPQANVALVQHLDAGRVVELLPQPGRGVVEDVAQDRDLTKSRDHEPPRGVAAVAARLTARRDARR